MLRLAIISIAGLVTLAATSAMAQGGWQVNDLPGQGQFEVLEGPDATPGAHWCAAGQHAQRRLRATGSTRIYLMKALGQAETKKGTRAVGYTLKPDQALLDRATKPGQNGDYSVSVEKVGFGLTVIHALNFCAGSGRG